MYRYIHSLSIGGDAVRKQIERAGESKFAEINFIQFVTIFLLQYWSETKHFIHYLHHVSFIKRKPFFLLLKKFQIRFPQWICIIQNYTLFVIREERRSSNKYYYSFKRQIARNHYDLGLHWFMHYPDTDSYCKRRHII